MRIEFESENVHLDDSFLGRRCDVGLVKVVLELERTLGNVGVYGVLKCLGHGAQVPIGMIGVGDGQTRLRHTPLVQLALLFSQRVPLVDQPLHAFANRRRQRLLALLARHYLGEGVEGRVRSERGAHRVRFGADLGVAGVDCGGCACRLLAPLGDLVDLFVDGLLAARVAYLLALGAIGRHDGVVVGEEVELLVAAGEEGRLLDGQAVLAVLELNDAVVAVAHRQIVAHDDALEVFDETALQVAAAARLDRRVDEALAARHAVEEVLLGREAAHEAVGDEAAARRRRIVGQKRGQRVAVGHEARPPALELLLAEQTRHLHGVDARALGARLDHELQVVAREVLDEAVGKADVRQRVLIRVHGALVRQVDLLHVRVVRVQVTPLVQLAQATLALLLVHGGNLFSIIIWIFKMKYDYKVRIFLQI